MLGGMQMKLTQRCDVPLIEIPTTTQQTTCPVRETGKAAATMEGTGYTTRLPVKTIEIEESAGSRVALYKHGINKI